MADEKQAGPGLGGNSIIILLVAAASAVYVGWQKPPLVSSRPTNLGPELHGVQSPQDVDARLWQDPFAAVKQYIDDKRNTESKSNLHSIDYFRKELIERDTLILGVSLSGAPYPEAAENRRRLRYAVLAGLHVANYFPEDERHIGYFDPNPKPFPGIAKPEVVAKAAFSIGSPAGTTPSADGKFSLKLEEPPIAPDPKRLVPAVVPFEMFDNTNGRRVAVLWLDEDELVADATPLTNLFQLFCALKLPSDGKFAVLGPQDSTTLNVMRSEIKRSPHPGESCPSGGKLHLINYGATANLEQAFDTERSPSDAGISYFRNVSSDQQVAAVLAGELARRGVDLTESAKCADPRTGKPQS
jgi:hypothetical protein